MQFIPQSVQSPILAQKLLSEPKIISLDSKTIHEKIEINLCDSDMPNISTIPTFNSTKKEPLRSDFGLPVPELIKLISRKAKNTYEKMLNSENGQKLLIKALQYKIPFDRDDIDWLNLSDEVGEYEELIVKCDNYGIDWIDEEYDPVYLEQQVEAYEHKEYENAKADYYGFYRGAV